MTERPVFVGLDGGGTRLRALVVEEDGTERGRAEIPAVPVRAGDPGPVVDAVRRVVEAAIDVTLLSRYYERYADHAVSVTRRVVTIVTGEPYVGVSL